MRSHIIFFLICVLLSCVDELNVHRDSRSAQSLGEISFEVAQQEATLAERASIERVNHLTLHQNLVIKYSLDPETYC